MKKAIFVVHRSLYYRSFAALLDEALSRGFEVEAWHDYSHPRYGNKSHSFPDISLISKPTGSNSLKASAFFGKDELRNKISHLGNSDFLFSLHAPCYYWNGEGSNFDFNWVMLQTLDSFFELSEIEKNKFNPVIFALHSGGWLELGREYLRRFSRRRDDLILSNFSNEIVGVPEFDSFKYLKQPGSISEKYGIPKDKNILLYLPFPYQNWNPRSAWEKAFVGLGANTRVLRDGSLDHHKKMPLLNKVIEDAKNMCAILKDSSASYYWRRGINEANVFKAVKEFARENNLFTVVKPRLKFPVCQYVKEKADLLVLDDERQNNPTRLMELLSVAKAAVSYCSFSVTSAAFAKVFHINITPPKDFFLEDKYAFFYTKVAPSHFNYQGVSECLSPQEAILGLPGRNLGDFAIDLKQRKQYVHDYIGFDDYDSSKRLFNLLNKD